MLRALRFLGAAAPFPLPELFAGDLAGLAFFADAPDFPLVPVEAFVARFEPALRAAEGAEVRFAPLPLPLRAPVERLPLFFRGCVSISKFASSRALRSPLMNPQHSMLPV